MNVAPTHGATVRAVAVVVPAHDEADLIGACLDALASARAVLVAARPDVAVSVTVVLDACRDATAALVAEWPEVDALAVDLHCVGAARGAGTVDAVARFALPPAAVWTAHTDADSQVPPTWLLGMVDEAETGADAVLGLVTPDDATSAPLRAAWATLNPSVEHHPYVHGANLGVRASTLVGMGGWAPLATGEDVELAQQLRTRPGTVLRCVATNPVVTSSRSVGRAPDGFSGYLRELTVA